jgi:hypothetical protein
MESRAGGGAAAAVRLWARSEFARRWRALVVLGIIAGVVGGLALAALSGARRTATAYERWRVATAAPDAILFATQVGVANADYSPVLKLPEVLDAGQFTLSPLGLQGIEIGALPPADDRLYRTVSRPLLVHGRLPDPSRPDEILVNRAAAAQYHMHVGQHVTVISATDPTAFYGQAPMTGGPTVQATIVGVGDSMIDILFMEGHPAFEPSAGFLAAAPQVPRASNLVVRLRPGTDVTAFHEHAVAAMHLPDVPVRDLAEDRKRFTHATDLERTALLLFAAAVVLAGLVLVGQALSRAVYGMTEPAPALRAMGFTRPNLVAGLVIPMAVTALTAAGAAIASAVALSSRFPVGLARRLDPHVGLHADWRILGPGAAALFVLVLLGAAVAAYRAAVALDRPLQSSAGSTIAKAIRTAAPLPVGIGAGLALEAGRGERAMPVRPAIAGAMAGVVGVIGALGLVHGIDDSLARPARAGQVWDAVVWPSDQLPPPALLGQLRSDREVEAVADMVRAPLDVNGAGLPVYAFDPVEGEMSFVMLHGRAPKGPDEVVLGPASAQALHRKVGDQVRITGTTGASLTVVGIALLPQTPHSSFDQGAWVTRGRLATLIDLKADHIDEEFPVVARKGIKPDTLVTNLQRRFSSSEVDATRPPQDVLLLHNVRTLPRALAVFLVLLGIAAVGHVLVTGVRRRRHDFAVLRALGFRPRQNAAVIAWQATTIAAVGLAFGLPLGVLAGRLSWRWVADSTPLLYVAPVAAVALLAAIPAAIVLANALAAWPGRRAARLRPGEVLRAE